MIKRFLLWLWREIPFPFPVRYLFLRSINQKFLIGVNALVVNDDQEVLLFKHSYRKTIPWGLPGGWLKKGETPEVAIKREISEESGYHLRSIKPLMIDKSGKYSKLDIIYVGQLEPGKKFKPSLEVVDAKFFAMNHLPKLLNKQEEIIKNYLLSPES